MKIIRVTVIFWAMASIINQTSKSALHLLLVLIIMAGISSAQNPTEIKEKIYDRGEELEDLRTTINDLKKELVRKETTEIDYLRQIRILNKQIDFTNRLLARLDQEILVRDRGVTIAREEVELSRDNLVKLRDRFAKRAVKMYKAGTYSDFELLLTSASVSQFFYRMKYLKIINDHDRKLFASINIAIRNLKEKERILLREIDQREGVRSEKKSEKQSLSKNRVERRGLLKKIRQDQGALKRLVKEKEEAAKQVESIIVALEDERKRLEELARRRKVPIEELAIDANFASYKGKLIWPVVGKVTARFGKRRHPKLKTITENSGIDIAAKEGTEVVSVLTGRITSITWIRGFGNTVIIDHGSGYYSVYTHLGEIYVTPNETVASGHRIATVGETDSIDNSAFHFEIWYNRQKQDPMKWLKKAL